MQQPPPLPTVNPYAAPTARVVDIASDELVLADRGIRLLAVIVDGLVVAGPMMVMAIIAGIVAGASGTKNTDTVVGLLFGVMGLSALVVLVINFVLLHRHGQTIAKRWFGIKVVRGDGGRCGLMRIVFARWFPVALLGAIPLIGLLIKLTDSLMIFRDDFRCLHDLIADTIVVKA
ncbi:MAG: RDD family protein [Tahibacter sp.]